MKQKLLKTMLLLCALIVGGVSSVWGDTYEQLTSIANIDESAEYVLGIDGTGFHYEGTSSWGKTALPSAQTPIKYTLTKAQDGNSFTAKATISETTYYLQVPTSNTFSMATSTGTNTDLIIGTTKISGTNYAVANKTTTDRHLRINGTSGLRSYAGTTGTMAFFYKIVPSAPAYTITAQSNNDSYGTVSLSGSVITGSPNSGYRYADPAYTVSPENSATVVQNGNEFTVTPTENTTVTINFEAIPCYTVTLSDDTENPMTEYSPGVGCTLPSRSAIGDYTFAGWSETNVSEETTTPPTIIPAGTYYPTANITLYPVYSKTEGGLTPSAFSIGDTGNFAIVSEMQNGKYYALPTKPTLNSGKITAQEITVSESGDVKYVTPSDATDFIWTIADAANGYTLSDGTNYIYHSNGGASGTNLTYGTSTSYTWSFTKDGDYIKMFGMSGSTTNSRGLLFNGTTIGGYALSNWGSGSYYKSMILPISAGSTTYYWSSPALPSDYITVSPTTKDVTSVGGDAEFAINTDQTLDEDPTQFYTTVDGDETTDKPAWITEVLYDEGTLLVTVEPNTGAARTAYFKVEKESIKSEVITINQAAITVATPEFDVEAGTYTSDQLVDITCETAGATIYYTTDGSTPDNNSTEYDGNGVEITANTTLKAIAIKNEVSSEVASATYTIIHPLTTMDAIFTASETAGSYYVTLNNWVVSGVSGNQAFVTDGTKGFIVYKSGHGFSVGNILSGTVQASLTRYNGSAEFTTLTSSTTGLTVTTGGTVSPQVVSISDLNGVNTGALIQLKGVTYNGTALVDANSNTITPYTTLYTGSYTNGTKYNIVGVYQQQSSAPHRILPRSSADIVEALDPTITVASSLAVPNYIVGTAEPTCEMLTVNGSNLTADITLSLGVSSNFEMSTDLDTWTNSLTLTQTDGSVTNAEVAIRLKAGLAKNAYEGTLTLSSTGADNVEVNLSGTVTGTTYTINIDDNVTGGTIEADWASAEEGATVTLTATPDAAYTFGSWTVIEDDLETEVAVTDNQFTMPACEVYVTATFNAKPTYAITCVASPVAGGEIEASPASAYEGQTVTLNYLAESGYDLSSIVITKTSDGSATGITPAASGDDFTFTMPGYAVTATATFLSNTFEGSFAKVTSISALEDGGYYILYSTKAMNSTVTSGKMGATAVTINNDIIENPDKSIVWKLVKNGDNWDLYSEKEGKYCYIEGTNTSAFKMAASASYHYAVTTYASGGGFKFKTTHSSNRGINYGNNDFGSYADSNSPTVYLYKYTDLTPRTITFNGNGGTYNEASTYTQTVYDGVEATLDANTFTRNGYEFVTWNTEDDGSGDTYENEGAITVTGGDLMLYAQWAPLYTLTIDNSIEGGSVAVVGNVTSAIEGTEITLASTPSAGHTFGEWNVYKEGDPSTIVTVDNNNQFAMPAYNVVISATFEEIPTYSLVTDANDIVPGKHYIIASGTDGSVKAMGEQSTNNRSAVSVTASSGIIPETDGVYELVIYGPDANGYYTIYDETNSKYLYAASSSSNYLKTQEDNNANGKWTIEIANTGVATVKAQGSYTRNWMRNNGNLFSCYGSGQSDIYLYVKDGDTPVATTTSVKLNGFGYATFASTNTLDFLDAEADGVEYSAWQITGISGEAITFGQIKSTVAAGKGVLLKGTPNATISLNILPVGGATLSENKLEGITEATDVAANEYYGLKGNSFVKVNAGTIPAGKALLPASVVGGSDIKAFNFVFEDDPDGIENIEHGTFNIENSIYDLSGRKINGQSSMVNGQLPKGIYIVNGKKVMVK